MTEFPHTMSIPERAYHYLREAGVDSSHRSQEVKKVIGGDPSAFFSKLKELGMMHHFENGDWIVDQKLIDDTSLKFHGRVMRQRKKPHQKSWQDHLEPNPKGAYGSVLNNPVQQSMTISYEPHPEQEVDVLENLLQAMSAAEEKIRELQHIQKTLADLVKK